MYFQLQNTLKNNHNHTSKKSRKIGRDASFFYDINCYIFRKEKHKNEDDKYLDCYILKFLNDKTSI